MVARSGPVCRSALVAVLRRISESEGEEIPGRSGLDGYAAGMLSRCSRCGTPAATFMTFDYSARAVWLDDLGAHGEVPGYAMCVDHADRLTPPMGWTLADRRTVTPLFAFDVA